MIIETTYSDHELHSGKCSSCGDQSVEILNGDGRCIDCIEADKFYEMTMKGASYKAYKNDEDLD